MSEETGNKAAESVELVVYTDLAKELPKQIAFNYDELKADLQKTLEPLKGLVLEKTEENKKYAKNKRASVNKVAKMISDKRIEMKTLYLEPFNEFERRANELTAMCKEVSAGLDTFVKEVEEDEKSKKREAIHKHILDKVAEVFAGNEDAIKSNHWAMFEAANPKWLNATVKVTTAFAEIDAHVDDCKSACESVEGLYASHSAEALGKAKVEIRKDFDINRVVKCVNGYLEEQERIKQAAKEKFEREEAEKRRRIEEEAKEKARREAEEKARKECEEAERKRREEEERAEAERKERDAKAALAAKRAAASGQGAPVPAEKPVVINVDSTRMKTVDVKPTGATGEAVAEEEPTDTFTLKLECDAEKLRETAAWCAENGITVECATVRFTGKRSAFFPLKHLFEMNGVGFEKVEG